MESFFSRGSSFEEVFCELRALATAAMEGDDCVSVGTTNLDGYYVITGLSSIANEYTNNILD